MIQDNSVSIYRDDVMDGSPLGFKSPIISSSAMGTRLLRAVRDISTISPAAKAPDYVAPKLVASVPDILKSPVSIFIGGVLILFLMFKK